MQHQKQEQVLQCRLGDAQQKKADTPRGRQNRPGKQMARRAEMLKLVLGWRVLEKAEQRFASQVPLLQAWLCPQHVARMILLQGLVHSGTQILSEVGVDQNTTQFIANQAMRVKGRTMGVNRGRSLT